MASNKLLFTMRRKLKAFVAAGAAFTSFNSAWTAIGFTGAGTAASKYAATFLYANAPAADGAQATVSASGTIRITAVNASSWNNYVVYKNNVAAATYADNSGDGSGFGGAIDITFTVAAGDVIRLGDTAATGPTGADNDVYDTLRVWWQ